MRSDPRGVARPSETSPSTPTPHPPPNTAEILENTPPKLTPELTPELTPGLWTVFFFEKKTWTEKGPEIGPNWLDRKFEAPLSTQLPPGGGERNYGNFGSPFSVHHWLSIWLFVDVIRSPSRSPFRSPIRSCVSARFRPLAETSSPKVVGQTS